MRLQEKDECGWCGSEVTGMLATTHDHLPICRNCEFWNPYVIACCPNCGSENVHEVLMGGHRCFSCGLQGKSGISKRAATLAWNTGARYWPPQTCNEPVSR